MQSNNKATGNEALWVFPSAFPIKIMGLREDGFAQSIAELVMQHAPDFDPATMEFRNSKEGKYLGLTVTITAQSKEQLDGLYQALTKHPMVKIVL